MNIRTVVENLRNIIASKERLYQTYSSDMDYASMSEAYIIRAKRQLVQDNIAELKKILADVEACATEQSWRLNPDRSGGQFTQDEIDNHGRWI